MQKQILVVDDEKPIVDILRFNLQKEGYSVLEAYDGLDAVKKAVEYRPDLILLDVMLPLLDGFGVCKEVRQHMDTPILMLTARDEELDKVLGLELGADDYITKPFSIRELLARVKANIRRLGAMEGVITDNGGVELLKIGELVLNCGKYELAKSGQSIRLTLREFEVLKLLMMNKEKIFSREQLLEKVWGYEYYGDVRTVDVTIRRLREKIEVDSSVPQYILTKRSIGYYIAEPE